MFVHSHPTCFYYFCLDSAFNPKASSDRTLLYEAPPIVVAPQPSSSTPQEGDFSEMDSSNSSSSDALGSNDGPTGGFGSANFLESGFFSTVSI